MKTENNLPGAQLEDAFNQFNQLSATLAESYGDLQKQVERLSRELAEARSERLKQLAEKERIANRLERLLDTLPAGIVVLDGDGHVNQANPVAHDMLGSDLMGRPWESIAQQNIKTEGDELRLKDGRWISVSTRSLNAEPGRIVLITDISETHALQTIISRQQRLTSLGEMLAGLAHQIRTPLATAMLHLSNTTHPNVNGADRAHYAGKAKERLHHLERMVNDMLIFARGEITDAEHFDVTAFVDAFRQALEPQFRQTQAKLIIDNQVGKANIRANKDSLMSAFHNLVNNAIEAGDQSPVIRIQICLNDVDGVEFRFSDNGCGIPDAIKDRIVEPFFTTRKHGTGLGLAVVNATVARFQGSFEVQSEVGVGSCFIVRLPVVGNNTLLPSRFTSAAKPLGRPDDKPANEDANTDELQDLKEVSI